jgi:hypothetical protein
MQRQRQGWYGGWAPPGSERPAPPEDADALLAGAVHLQQCPDHDERELPDCLDALAERDGEADRAVMSQLQRTVTSCWRRGWQPADLVRVVGRRAGARPAAMATDGIVAELRGYASATVDDTWAAQLAELDGTAWWERDDRFLEAWGARHGVPRAAALGSAVEVLGLLEQLPELPRLAPLPGTARQRGATARRDPTPVDERMLERVRALLAKAESTTFPEEAEAYTAKAQELMARHSIDQALLAAGAPVRDGPAGRRLGVDNPYEQPKALLLDCVATANRCRAVWDKQYGFSTVMGFPTDLDAVELLYTSLLVQATAAMLHEGSRQDRYGRSRTRSFRQSVLTAYATRIGQRLSSATEQATQQAAAGRGDLLPVLAARDHDVDEVVAELFPGIVKRGVRATDREGWASGTAAADRASLGVRGQVTGAGR